ncbi:MAG TPA: GNVR domain-containing protein, partial [Gemmatimonadaceae bacterium]|nr:GNVR domain-containing protein [Gemmatimonadaceae bacterium]
ASENALRVFEEQSRLIAPQEQAASEVKRVGEISTRVDAISAERDALSRMLTIIQDRSRGGADPAAYRQLATFPTLITNRAIQDLLNTLIGLENQRSALGVRRTEANPEYKQLSDRILEIDRQLYAVGPQYLESLDQELATTVHTVSALMDTLGAMPTAVTEFGRLVRDRTVYEATYVALQKQLKVAELKDVLRKQRVRVVDHPRVANVDDPAFPKKGVMIALGAVLAIMCAIAVGLVVELWG